MKTSLSRFIFGSKARKYIGGVFRMKKLCVQSTVQSINLFSFFFFIYFLNTHDYIINCTIYCAHIIIVLRESRYLRGC